MKENAKLVLSNELSVVPLSSPDQGEVALVNIDILRELLNSHTIRVSLRELKDNIIEKIRDCTNIQDYTKVLVYDLNMLALHENFKAYEDRRFNEKGAQVDRQQSSI